MVTGASIAAFATALLAPSARAVTGGGVLATAPSASALYTVTCYDDGNGAPVSLVAQVSDEGPAVAPFVSVQVVKGLAATNSTDPVDADGAPGPLVALDGGAGDYAVFVDKTGAGEETFALTVECRTGAGGGGVATGTDVDGFAPPPAVPALGAAAWLGAAALLGSAGAARLRRRS